ncbi:MAG: hypothetical protein GY703_09630 [Gammaproteobacteria bacterium]|nr:hypothetical protein [Gammaproteobacteria bacterium]
MMTNTNDFQSDPLQRERSLRIKYQALRVIADEMADMIDLLAKDIRDGGGTAAAELDLIDRYAQLTKDHEDR